MAAAKVLAIPELLENVLLALIDEDEVLSAYAALRLAPAEQISPSSRDLSSIPTLFALRRVKKTWRDTIDGCKALGKAMYLEGGDATNILSHAPVFWFLHKARPAIMRAASQHELTARSIAVTIDLPGAGAYTRRWDDHVATLPLQVDDTHHRSRHFLQNDAIESWRAMKLTKDFKVTVKVQRVGKGRKAGEIQEIIYEEQWSSNDEPVTLGKVFDKYCEIFSREAKEPERRERRETRREDHRVRSRDTRTEEPNKGICVYWGIEPRR